MCVHAHLSMCSTLFHHGIVHAHTLAECTHARAHVCAQVYFWQVTGQDWQDFDQPGQEYKKAKKRHERLLPHAKTREQKRDRSQRDRVGEVSSGIVKRKRERLLPHNKAREQERDRSQRDRDGELSHTYSSKKASRARPEAQAAERLRGQEPHRQHNRPNRSSDVVAVDAFRGARILPGSKTAGDCVYMKGSELPCRQFAWPQEQDQKMYDRGGLDLGLDLGFGYLPSSWMPANMPTWLPDAQGREARLRAQDAERYRLHGHPAPQGF